MKLQKVNGNGHDEDHERALVHLARRREDHARAVRMHELTSRLEDWLDSGAPPNEDINAVRAELRVLSQQNRQRLRESIEEDLSSEADRIEAAEADLYRRGPPS